MNKKRSDPYAGLEYPESEDMKRESKPNKRRISESDIDILLHALNEKNIPDINILGSLPGIESLPAFRRVVGEYISTDTPPSLDFAITATVVTLRWLIQLHDRIQEFQLTGDGTKQDRLWTETQSKWRENQVRLVEILHEAAALMDSGRNTVPMLNRDEPLGKNDWRGDADNVFRCSAEDLWCCAQIINASPVETVFPLARPRPYSWRLGDLGKRGGASDPYGSLRAMAVRQIAKCLPKSMRSRYSTIAELAMFIGLDVNRQYVRSLLMKGHT